jgi:hypothetical protein
MKFLIFFYSCGSFLPSCADPDPAYQKQCGSGSMSVSMSFSVCTSQVAEQEQTPLSEMPKLTVSMLGQKISDLDSEVNVFFT